MDVEMKINGVIEKLKGQMENKAKVISFNKLEGEQILRNLIERTRRDGMEKEKIMEENIKEKAVKAEKDSVELLHDFEIEQLEKKVKDLESQLYSESQQHKVEMDWLKEQHKQLMTHVLESDGKKTESINELVDYLNNQKKTPPQREI